jgi:uncharacterized membrane protein
MPKIFKIFIPLWLIFSFFAGEALAQLDASVVEALPKEAKSENLNLQKETNPLASQNSYLEEISDYKVRIEINKDASLVITESILYDFKSLQRHGIFRDIPYKYKDKRGANYKLRLKVISVIDESGAAYLYKISKSGNNFSIKIGDPNKYVTGKKTYIIKYKVERGMRFFKDYDELYWNAIGHGWNLDILAGRTKIILPKEVNKEQLKYDCFTGSYGATFRDCQINILDKRTVEFVLSEILTSYSGMTIVLGIPKSLIKKDLSKEILWYIFDNWPLLLVPLVFIFLFYRWWRYGREPHGRGTIVAQYEAPDNLRPGEVGVIIDQDVDNKDVSASLIDLAVRGYLKIKEIKKGEYQFVKLKGGEDLQDFEKELFEGIFGSAQTKLLSSLKYNFAGKFTKIKDSLYEKVTEKGYFPKNPNLVKNGYLVTGVSLVIASIFLGVFIQSGIYFLGFLVSGLIFVGFSFFMSRRSYKGVLAYEHILGFKDFLSVTEKERLKFHNAPKKRPELFEKFLPYATVLGVENEWAKQFEGIYNQQPSFYESYDSRPFIAYDFISNLNSFSSTTSQTFVATPKTSSGSFGSSGFGGGGGGGGGGGSW